MPPVRCYMKNKNCYTLKQKIYKNIRREKYSSTPGIMLNPSKFKLTPASILCKLSRNMSPTSILSHTIIPQAPLSSTTHGCNRISKSPWNFMIYPTPNKDFSSMMMINGHSAWAAKTNQKTKIPSSPPMTSSTPLPISSSPNNYWNDGSQSTRCTSCKKYTPPLTKSSVISSSPNPPTQPTSWTLQSDIFFKKIHWHL